MAERKFSSGNSAGLTEIAGRSQGFELIFLSRPFALAVRFVRLVPPGAAHSDQHALRYPSPREPGLTTTDPTPIFHLMIVAVIGFIACPCPDSAQTVPTHGGVDASAMARLTRRSKLLGRRRGRQYGRPTRGEERPRILDTAVQAPAERKGDNEKGEGHGHGRSLFHASGGGADFRDVMPGVHRLN